jgi:hypothetical protein
MPCRINFGLQTPQKGPWSALLIRRREGSAKGSVHLIGIGKVAAHFLAPEI